MFGMEDDTHELESPQQAEKFSKWYPSVKQLKPSRIDLCSQRGCEPGSALP